MDEEILADFFDWMEEYTPISDGPAFESKQIP